MNIIRENAQQNKISSIRQNPLELHNATASFEKVFGKNKDDSSNVNKTNGKDSQFDTNREWAPNFYERGDSDDSNWSVKTQRYNHETVNNFNGKIHLIEEMEQDSNAAMVSPDKISVSEVDIDNYLEMKRACDDTKKRKISKQMNDTSAQKRQRNWSPSSHDTQSDVQLRSPELDDTRSDVQLRSPELDDTRSDSQRRSPNPFIAPPNAIRSQIRRSSRSSSRSRHFQGHPSERHRYQYPSRSRSPSHARLQRSSRSSSHSRHSRHSQVRAIERHQHRNTSRSRSRSQRRHSRSPSHSRSQSVQSSSRRNGRLRVDCANPSREMAEKLRSQTDVFFRAELTKTNLSQAFCFVCEEILKMDLSEWKDHLLNHTGEMKFYCTKCNISLKSTQKTHCSGYSIVPTFSGKNGLKGFLCSICDHLKINEQTVTEHVMQEHQKTAYEAENIVDKVILLPNFARRHFKITTNYKFVQASKRFVCGVRNCAHEGAFDDRPGRLVGHIRAVHSKAGIFTCPHCGETVEADDINEFVTLILNHLYRHSSIVNQCTACDLVFTCDYDVISHMLNDHDDNDGHTYRRDRRGQWNGTLKQEVIVLFECLICKARFDNPNRAVHHCLFQHEEYNAHLKLVELIKETSNGSSTKYTFEESDKNLVLQQLFKCKLCQELMSNKEQIVRHQNEMHKLDDLAITSIMHLKSYDVKSYFHPKRNSLDEHLMYHCDHCCEPLSVSTFYQNVPAVYDHWKSAHKIDAKPFRFRVAPLAKCRYCDFISTYEGLCTHQTNEHPKKRFVIRNLIHDSKCGLCLSTENRLTEHFDTAHQEVLKANLFSPIALSNDLLNKLRNVNGHIKSRCKRCDYMCESKNELTEHHEKQHPTKRISMEHFYDKESIHLITGCCQSKLDPDGLVDHLAEHRLPNKNTLAQFYWKTKVVCGNGLVLNKHNLLNTDLDDSKKFADFVKRFC